MNEAVIMAYEYAEIIMADLKNLGLDVRYQSGINKAIDRAAFLEIHHKGRMFYLGIWFQPVDVARPAGIYMDEKQFEQFYLPLCDGNLVQKLYEYCVN